MNWAHPKSQVIGWLPTAPRMGFAASGIGLPFVLGGITPAWTPDVHAGMFIGWLHSNAAYIAQLKVGGGKLLLCTIPVAGGAGVEPFATRLYHELYVTRQMIPCSRARAGIHNHEGSMPHTAPLRSLTPNGGNITRKGSCSSSVRWVTTSWQSSGRNAGCS